MSIYYVSWDLKNIAVSSLFFLNVKNVPMMVKKYGMCCDTHSKRMRIYLTAVVLKDEKK
jgi:hypothetical protein